MDSTTGRLRLLLFAWIVALAGCDSASPVDAGPDGVRPELGRVGHSDRLDDEDDDEERGRPRIDFADLEIFLEFNATDDDLGVQVALDAEAWDRVRARDPRGHRVLDFVVNRELGVLGLTEIRFESAEPSPAEVLGSIPPGTYRFSGRAVDGARLVGEAELSHDLPAAPDFTPGDDDVVDPDDTVIRWDPIPGLEGYEVIVVNDESGAELSAVLGPDVTELPVPAAFMEAGATYKAEVLAIAENGNKTITEHVFRTSG